MADAAMGGAAMAALPLGTVLLPGQSMALRIFEPRYRVMLFDLRSDDPAEFIVNMIERGSEVGGGDVRAEIGCVARVVETQDAEDGTTNVAIIGTERARVIRWLVEDPYPMAEVLRVAEDSPPETEGILPTLVANGERVRNLAEALGQPIQSQGPDPLDDLSALVWRIALAAPLATIDRYKLLATDDLARRANLLGEQLEELGEILAGELAMRPPESDR